MKVNVIQAKDTTFGKFRWWSNWIDIALFSYCGDAYLLQMKISRTNAKRFKAIEMGNWLGVHPPISEVGDLTQMDRGRASNEL